MPGGTKKESKVWLYEAGVAPRLVSIKDEVAVEPHFYSELSSDGSKTLDDEITDYENVAARRLQALKSAPFDTAVDSETAAEIVAHLTIRNAHLRRTFTMGVKKLFGRAVEVFCNETSLRPLLGVDRNLPSQAIKDLIDQQLKENPALSASGLPSRVFYQIAQMILKERFSAFFTEHVPHLTAGLSTLVAEAPVFVRDGHNKALSLGLAPDKRIEMLRALCWRVLPSPDGGFVLPDCVALGADEKSDLKPLIAADLDKINAVLMPLSTDRMLLGIGATATAPTLTDFNAAAATASHTFFIAARSDNELEVLSRRIGKYSEQLVDETIGSTFDEFLTTRGVNLQAEAIDTRNVKPDAESQESPPKAPKYLVEFHSCVDQATEEKIRTTLNAITENLVQMMPLDRLDGITFSSDYPASLRNLDRGFPTSAPLKATTEEYGTGVAMAPLVMRDGIPKTHIVMRGEIGHSLISEDESIWRVALHTIAGQLAYAACAQILDESFPGVLLKRINDRYDSFLYAAIHSAWTGYFSSRASAGFYPDAGLPQQELLLAVLKRAQSDIPAARLAYRFHADIDRMLEVVMPRIADILRFSGTVLGHYDGLERSFLDDRLLAAALEDAGLRDWLALFDSELSQLWDRRQKWGSFDEFLMLNRHVERLLWQYGLFPYRTDEGQIQIVVPLATDAERLVGRRPRLRLIGATLSRRLKSLLNQIAEPFRRQRR